MFHAIPVPILERMKQLEEIDSRDRLDGTPHLERLRQIPPETGRFLALMAASAPPGKLIEIGTSAAYSSLWISLACRERQDRLLTFEVLPEKFDLAQETVRQTGSEAWIELVHGDARRDLQSFSEIAFCFLDAEKDIYQQCYELVVPKLVSGGLFLADNVLSHAEELHPFVSLVMNDARMDTVVVPVGKGVLLGRKK